MGGSSALEGALALWSLALGGLLCAVYDVFRLFRLCRKQNPFMLFFADIAFSLISAILTSLLFFNFSNGKMRAYPLMLMLVGFLIWRFTVSALIMQAMKRIFMRVRSLLGSARRYVILLIRLFVRKIATIIYCKRTLKSIRNIKPKGKEN